MTGRADFRKMGMRNKPRVNPFKPGASMKKKPAAIDSWAYGPLVMDGQETDQLVRYPVSPRPRIVRRK